MEDGNQSEERTMNSVDIMELKKGHTLFVHTSDFDLHRAPLVKPIIFVVYKYSN